MMYIAAEAESTNCLASFMRAWLVGLVGCCRLRCMSARAPDRPPLGGHSNVTCASYIRLWCDPARGEERDTGGSRLDVLYLHGQRDGVLCVDALGCGDAC